MATPIGGIKVRIGADTSGLETGLKKTREGLNQVGKWAAAASAASVVAIGAITKASAESAREIENLSRVANSSTTEFQKMAFASKQFGVDQDKLADILKDVNDRVGDFITTGAGPMVDFFEKIGPKVGVTIEDFKKLSGPEALQLFTSSLEKANLTQGEMTFHMEAMASDLTLLQPLLADNGKLFQQMGDEAENLGIVMSDIDISKLKSFDASLVKSTAAIGALGDRVAIKLSPILEALSEQFLDTSGEADGFAGAIDEAFDGATKVIGVFADGLHGIDIIFQGLKVGAFAIGKVVNEAFALLSKGLENFVNLGIIAINQLIEAANLIPGVMVDTLDSFNFEEADMFKRFSELASENLTGAIGDLHNKMMEPLPSQAINEWVEKVVEASDAVAEILLEGDGDRPGPAKALEELIAHQSTMTDVEADHARQRIQIAQDEAKMKAQAQQTFFNDLASLMNSGSKKAFKVGQTAALANAGINGVSAAIAAWDAGMSVGGPFAPLTAAAYAGASVLKTGAMMQKISSASFGSPSSPTSFSGGLPSVNTSGGQSQQGPTNVSIDIVGSENSTFSRGQIESLIGGINDATGDGVVLNTGG